ncbi:MAG TPA: ABC transporter permease [Spirochaetia bacterium]|nr:ABC transporter permease [Spirochaetia bacterium]
MPRYILRRAVFMVITLVSISIVTFIVIKLPPGDFLTRRIAQLESTGQRVDASQVAALKKEYGLDVPVVAQYLLWDWKMLHGNFGMSFGRLQPVNKLIAERLTLNLAISLFTLLFTYLLSIPIGIFSATHQYSVWDYLFTVLGFVGVSIPGFLLGLILMLFLNRTLGISVGGLFSSEYITAPWSVGKFVDMMKHLPLPIVIIGASGTAWFIRVMRSCLLDELPKQYVITARAKGLSETRLVWKYPVKVAVNPIISTISWQLPNIFSGETIIAIVLNLPTMGPLLFEALLNQDMYLAGSIVMILGFLTVVGTFLSDMLLIALDPRIRLGN